MNAFQRPSIEVTAEGVRLGKTTRRRQFVDHTIRGFVLQGDRVKSQGTWISRPWTDEEGAEWIRRETAWQYFSWNWLRRLLGVTRPADGHIAVRDCMVLPDASLPDPRNHADLDRV